MPTITRRIQLYINGEKPYRDEAYKKLNTWNEICWRSANYIANHVFFQINTNEFFYMHDDATFKLTDREKDENGIFNTSKVNTTYRLVSSKFKGECPMLMLSALNNHVHKQFSAKKKELFAGKTSNISYKRDNPMPAPTQGLRDMKKDPEKKGNYTFKFFGIEMATFFGRDLSGNEIIMDRASTGEYELCDSSVQLKNGKIFLLAVIKFEKENKPSLDAEKHLRAELGVDHPIIFTTADKSYVIGNKDEYLHRRLQIQAALRNIQIASTFNKGGKGRKKKMKATDHFVEAEKNYIKTRVHQYTAKLVDWCVKLQCGTLVLVAQQEKEEEAKADKLLLRNWGYYGIKEKLKYKCALQGIQLVVE